MLRGHTGSTGKVLLLWSLKKYHKDSWLSCKKKEYNFGESHIGSELTHIPPLCHMDLLFHKGQGVGRPEII
jgi:hypothetical protein